MRLIDKQEEIQKLKDQLTALDTKITEAEALVKVEERNYRSKTKILKQSRTMICLV